MCRRHSTRYHARVASPQLREFSIEGTVRAVEKVRDRLRRSTQALERASVLYAVVGGNAVAAWVSRVDESAVRTTRDVDVLLRREDLDRASRALGAAGFCFRHSAGLDMFLDGPEATARDAVHVVFARERVRADSLFASPDVSESERADDYQIVSLEGLLRMKLTAYRRKDQVHVLDMIGVGLIDRGWLDRLPPELALRLRELMENPDD